MKNIIGNEKLKNIIMVLEYYFDFFRKRYYFLEGRILLKMNLFYKWERYLLFGLKVNLLI